MYFFVFLKRNVFISSIHFWRNIILILNILLRFFCYKCGNQLGVFIFPFYNFNNKTIKQVYASEQLQCNSEHLISFICIPMREKIMRQRIFCRAFCKSNSNQIWFFSFHVHIFQRLRNGNQIVYSNLFISTVEMS